MPEIVQFTGKSGDICGGLRRLADRIEEGEFPDLQFVVAVAVAHNAAFTAFGWGQCSLLEAVGAFARAVKCDLVDE